MSRPLPIADLHQPVRTVRAAPPRRPRRFTRERLAELTDGQLVTLALNGEERAFPVLMRRYEPKIRAVVKKRIPAPEEAAEIIQETLLSAWAALQSYPVERPFEIWLICIALNKCRDWGRRRSVRHRAAIYLPYLEREAPHDAETGLIAEEDGRRLNRALEALPLALRAPLELTAFAGLGQREAARRLGVTAKAVETRVRRARLSLKEALTA